MNYNSTTEADKLVEPTQSEDTCCENPNPMNVGHLKVEHSYDSMLGLVGELVRNGYNVTVQAKYAKDALGHNKYIDGYLIEYIGE